MANIPTDFSLWSTVDSSNQPDTSDPNTIPADMRAIQAALRTIFPNVDAALTPTHTELNYVDGVTSAIQTQLDAKLASSDFSLASQAEAEAGVENTKYMSPLRVKQSITANAPSPSSASDTVAGIVELATDAEVITGTDTARAVTPAGMKAGLNATGSAPLYACRAWAKVNGTGTVSLDGSGNIASLTDGGVGILVFTFTTAMPDANYAIDCTSTLSIGSRQGGVSCSVGAKSTTGFTLYTSNSGATAQDHEHVSVAIFR